jgi:hypothetical protein
MQFLDRHFARPRGSTIIVTFPAGENTSADAVAVAPAKVVVPGVEMVDRGGIVRRLLADSSFHQPRQSTAPVTMRLGQPLFYPLRTQSPAHSFRLPTY